MKKVFIAGPIPEEGLKLLKSHFDVEMYEGEGIIDKETLKAGVKDAFGLVSLLSTEVDQEVIDSGSELEFIANYGAGFNNVDVDYARSKNIGVSNTPKASTRSTAELTFGILLAVARRIPEGDQLMRHEGFGGWAPLFFRGREVSGKKIGIIGLGEIGSAVAQRAKGFDMEILYTGPHQKLEKEKELGAQYVDLETLLKTADFVTINAAYNPSMRHMIDKAQLELMKPTSYLINASRGPIVHEQALLEALQNKTIEGAALDVYEFEPEITEGLKSLDNVVITPHIGNATYEARDMMAEIVANNLIKKSKGEKPDYIVNE
ncbi:2-hydroxyacid dehydrogenase family protein [Staphylococcus coagulans]|uniref:2-hydroxyacid dehydrogenase family protein n=1 Tax=Staphylococcus coagulans TaxID=74706 RepID=A0ABU1EW06_9STAP|nr:2-hydroxyacid dehydrogenase family protein [Staphylococcus coagulans]MDR5602309.1 2-hydroxyacid dehydrogenase family protein [Staphylococcus coagulans]